MMMMMMIILRIMTRSFEIWVVCHFQIWHPRETHYELRTVALKSANWVLSTRVFSLSLMTTSKHP
jgi:hypothetical protein